jgi:hypothetical protein
LTAARPRPRIRAKETPVLSARNQFVGKIKATEALIDKG